MNVQTTDVNRSRTDNKYTTVGLDTDPAHTIYLQGLNWGLELEIMRRCDICFTMSSGFSEALWIKRSKPTILVDAQPMYLLKLLRNRMQLFDIWSPRALAFHIRQPHTLERTLRYLGPIQIGKVRSAAAPRAASTQTSTSL